MQNSLMSERAIEQFPLLDLPFEILELIVSRAHSSSLVKLEMCSRAFKEMTSSSWYWRIRIQNEKQKIICVDSKIEDWKKIFFSAVEFESVALAAESTIASWKNKKDRFKLIFSPGVYIFDKLLDLRLNVDIYGLWDTPYAQKPANQKTTFICYGASVLRLSTTLSTKFSASIKNVSIVARKKGGKCGAGCMLHKANFLIENCEFSAEEEIALYTNTSTVTVRNCRFYESPYGLYALESTVQLNGCVFEKNELGVYMDKSNQGESTVADSLFSENDRGFSLEDSTAPLSIKRCTIERTKERGIWINPNCTCILEENRILNNFYGVKVLDKATITLVKNIITNNDSFGIDIAHDVKIHRLSDNEIKNNGAFGLMMPEYTAGDIFTREEILSSNVICDNKPDLILLPKRSKIKMLYSVGDNKEALKTNCKTCVANQICTFAGTASNYVVQEWYRCYTCFTNGSNKGVCAVCVKKCHDGHDVSFTPTVSRFYCDCGSGNNCRAVEVIEDTQ